MSKFLKPWNVKVGMRMRVGVTQWDSEFLEVVNVEKGRGKVTGVRCWRITVKMPACFAPFTGLPETVMRFREDRCEVLP